MSWNVKPIQLVEQYLTKAAIKLPSASDITRAAAFNTRCNLSVTILGALRKYAEMQFVSTRVE